MSSAMHSKWEERCHTPKYDKEDAPQIWAITFPHLLTLSKRD